MKHMRPGTYSVRTDPWLWLELEVLNSSVVAVVDIFNAKKGFRRKDWGVRIDVC